MSEKLKEGIVALIQRDDTKIWIREADVSRVEETREVGTDKKEKVIGTDLFFRGSGSATKHPFVALKPKPRQVLRLLGWLEE